LAGEFRCAAQGEEVSVSAAGEDYGWPGSHCIHQAVIYRKSSMFTGYLIHGHKNAVYFSQSFPKAWRTSDRTRNTAEGPRRRVLPLGAQEMQ
jgi:hypothetical protein